MVVIATAAATAAVATIAGEHSTFAFECSRAGMTRPDDLDEGCARRSPRRGGMSPPVNGSDEAKAAWEPVFVTARAAMPPPAGADVSLVG
ncbi:MAG: hypothetical protein O3C51_07340, partial [Planctomycetota bacterium]|nr:hypothetical protein [Planctomycetota bacterium]